MLNSDETGYRTSGDKRRLWALVAANFVFYKTALTRGAEVLVQLLGEVLTTGETAWLALSGDKSGLRRTGMNNL